MASSMGPMRGPNWLPRLDKTPVVVLPALCARAPRALLRSLRTVVHSEPPNSVKAQPWDKALKQLLQPASEVLNNHALTLSALAALLTIIAFLVGGIIWLRAPLEATQQHAVLLEGLKSQMSGMDTTLNTKVDALGTGFKTQMSGMDTALNTKMDALSTGLKTQMSGIDTALNTKMDALSTGLKTQMSGIDTALNTKMDALGTRMESMESKVGQRLDALEASAITFDKKVDMLHLKVDMLQLVMTNKVGLNSWSSSAGAVLQLATCGVGAVMLWQAWRGRNGGGQGGTAGAGSTT